MPFSASPRETHFLFLGEKQMKKLLSNWIFSIFTLIFIVILNIVFLCQPVFGTYDGEFKNDWGYDYDVSISFDNRVATIQNSYVSGGQKIELGLYYVYSNSIEIMAFSHYTSTTVEYRRINLTRNSVFSMYWGEAEGELYSTGAIWLQVGLAIFELVFLFRFISQFKNRNIINDEIVKTSPQKEEYSICPNCGWQIFDEEKSCSNCGYKK